MSQIDKTIAQYKDWQQLAEFAQAQQTTIIQISKKLQKIEDERDHLKKLLDSVPTAQKPDSNIQQFTDKDVEFICNMEIAKLKETSLVTELTYEQTKKLEIYSKVLNQVKLKPKDIEREVENLSDEAVLKLLKSNADDRK